MAKILFVTTRIPYPPWEGHQIRTYNLLKRVCEVHEVHLVSFVRSDEDPGHADHLRTICKSVELIDIPADQNKVKLLSTILSGVITKTPFVVIKYSAPEMKNALEKVIKNESPDLIHFDMLPLAQYLPLCGNIPTVLNDHNVESLLVERRAEAASSLAQKIFFSNQAPKLEAFEKFATKNATEVLACSQDDADILSKMGNGKSIHVIANGVDIEQFQPDTSPDNDTSAKVKVDQNKIIFVGGMGWFPNKDGMNFFIKEAMPLISDKNPDASLTVVGKSDGLAIPEQLRNKVSATGFVDDFRPLVHEAAVYILPLRVGSGTRLKLLEAMAMGKAIVSTTIGAEGVVLDDGKNVLIANTPEEIAAATLKLMDDKQLRDALGKAAHEQAENLYDWRILGDKLLAVYDTIL
ncbi:MAG: glycosyltransferase [Gammaproteobacteria bacterium]